jgi:DHA1 family bicyclomycin/chloramphenicol resistance-like MFS transporter|tara:strand:+ start:2206 stop:3351 length:1146 start_codon:yes stop_codon:yes gene_type:complete
MASLSPLTQHTILPSVVNIQEHFSLEFERIIYIFSISTFSMAIMHVLYGFLSDNFGRKKIILLALCLYLCSSFLILTIDHSFLLLLFFRFFQAAGACVGIVLSIAIIKDITPIKNTFKIISFVISANMAIPIFSPIIGGILNENFGWKSIHLFLLIVSIPLIIYTLFQLDETNIYTNQGSNKITKEFINLLYNKNFYILLTISLITIFTSFTFIAISPYLVIILKGYDSLDLGFFSFFVSLGFIIGSLISGFINNISAYMFIKIGTAVCLLNHFFLLIYLYYSKDFNLIILYFFISFSAMGKGLIIPSISGLIVNYNEKISGTSLGFISFIKLIFASVSIILVAKIVIQNYILIFLIYFILYIISFILVYFLYSNKSVYTI